MLHSSFSPLARMPDQRCACGSGNSNWVGWARRVLWAPNHIMSKQGFWLLEHEAEAAALHKSCFSQRIGEQKQHGSSVLCLEHWRILIYICWFHYPGTENKTISSLPVRLNPVMAEFHYGLVIRQLFSNLKLWKNTRRPLRCLISQQ